MLRASKVSADTGKATEKEAPGATKAVFTAIKHDSKLSLWCSWKGTNNWE
jgi:hypothetical protein